MPAYAEKAIRGTVAGQVQGVGFRYTTRLIAREAGVDGWVRNLPDGSVEVWVQGSEEAVEALRRFLEQGPRGAVVRTVEVVEVEPDPALTGFEVRF